MNARNTKNNITYFKGILTEYVSKQLCLTRHVVCKT